MCNKTWRCSTVSILEKAVVVYFMGAFDSLTIAEGVVSIGHAKLSGCHHPISFKISNYYPLKSRLLVLGSRIVGNLVERCMMMIVGLYSN